MRRPSSRSALIAGSTALLVDAPLRRTSRPALAGPCRRRSHVSPGLVRKGKVPVSNEILKIKLPRPAEADLSNGLHLIVLEDHRLPEISFQLIIPGAGGFFDPAEQPGLAVVHGLADAGRHARRGRRIRFPPSST